MTPNKDLEVTLFKYIRSTDTHPSDDEIRRNQASDNEAARKEWVKEGKSESQERHLSRKNEREMVSYNFH